MAGLLGGKQHKARVQELEAAMDALQSKVTELEQEAERSRERAERDSERRREAVAARQEAQEQVNRLQEKVAQLEGELERAREDEPDAHKLDYRHREHLNERRLGVVLERLRSFRAGPEGALTAVVHNDLPEAVSRTLGERAVLVEDAAPCIVLVDDARLVSLVLRPPVLPELEPTWDERFILDPDWFAPSGRFALALVRANLFAAGIYEGREQVSFKGFHPKVGRRHSKGGFSQGRFERIREEQIADHVKRCRETLNEFLGDEKRLYLVGQREIMDALSKDFKPEATRAVDATGPPRGALEEAFESFWTTELRLV